MKFPERTGIMPSHLKGDPVLSEFWRRIFYHDKNVLIAVVGGTGDRKSGSSIRLAMELDQKFNLNRIVLTAPEFLDLVERGEPHLDPEKAKKGKFLKLKKGAVIIWDETGVDNDNTEWFTLKSKVIKWTFTTFRYRNFIVFLTVPTLNMISIGIRRLLHGVLYMKGIPRDKEAYSPKKFAEGTFYWYYHDPFEGKAYRKMPIYRDEHGYTRQLTSYIVERPPLDFEEKYKDKKDFYAKNWFAIYKRQLHEVNKRLGGFDGTSVKENEATIIEKAIIENPKEFVIVKENTGIARFNAHLISHEYPELSSLSARTMAAKLNVLLDANKIKLPGD